jgi:hypothetical protein
MTPLAIEMPNTLYTVAKLLAIEGPNTLYTLFGL